MASVRQAKAAERLTEEQVYCRQCARIGLAPEQLASKQAQARRAAAAAAAVTATARVKAAVVE